MARIHAGKGYQRALVRETPHIANLSHYLRPREMFGTRVITKSARLRFLPKSKDFAENFARSLAPSLRHKPTSLGFVGLCACN